MDASKVIIPTIGRVVWFYPHENQNDGGFARHGGPTIQPYTALITHVWSDHMVNLCVFDANGMPHGRTSVELVQEDRTCPGGGGYCTWMPFQKGQAAKQESEANQQTAPLHVPRTFRQELEQAAVHAMAGRVAEQGHGGAAIGREVRQALDALLEKGEGAAPLVGLPVRDNHRTEHAVHASPLQFGFGRALAHIKDGRRVARAGWNGKGMWLYLNLGSHDKTEQRPLIDGVSRSLFTLGDDGTVTRLPNINMRAASGATVTGWLASQTDMLAEDWMLVE